MEQTFELRAKDWAGACKLMQDLANASDQHADVLKAIPPVIRNIETGLKEILERLDRLERRTW